MLKPKPQPPLAVMQKPRLSYKMLYGAIFITLAGYSYAQFEKYQLVRENNKLHAQIATLHSAPTLPPVTSGGVTVISCNPAELEKHLAEQAKQIDTVRLYLRAQTETRVKGLK